MTQDFAPPTLPPTPNISGLPQPPSGLHPSVSPAAVITPLAGGPAPAPPSAVGANVHGDPVTPSGLRARLRGLRGGYDVLESVW